MLRYNDTTTPLYQHHEFHTVHAMC